VPLPQKLSQLLQQQINTVKSVHEQDLADGFGEVYLPNALSRAYYHDADQPITSMAISLNTTRRGRGL
jgi:hypothetical protein